MGSWRGSNWMLLFFFFRCITYKGSAPNEAEESVDAEMTFKLARAYFCTGDPNWFENITDPGLKFFCELLYDMVCNRNLPHVETLIQWIIALEKSMNDDARYNNCMRGEVSNSVNDLICKGDRSVKSLANLLGFLAKWSCQSAKDEWHDATLCRFFKFLQRQASSLVHILAPFTCGESIQHTKREFFPESAFGLSILKEASHTDVNQVTDTAEVSFKKRQYDLSSMMKFLKNLVCDKNIFVQIVEYVEKDFAGEDGITKLAALLHGFICCTLVAIHN